MVQSVSSLYKTLVLISTTENISNTCLCYIDNNMLSTANTPLMCPVIKADVTHFLCYSHYFKMCVENPYFFSKKVFPYKFRYLLYH